MADDDKNICETLKIMFEELGYQVDVANNGKEAIQKWSKRNYETALIDIRLPDISGIEIP